MSVRNGPISVCALVLYPLDTTPSQRFRLEQWQPYLAAQGIKLDLVPFADRRLRQLLQQPGCWLAKAAGLAAAWLRRALHLASVRDYDVVVVHRAACLIGPAVLERALVRLRRPVIFDFDDAIYMLNTSASNRRFGWLKFPGKTAALCRLSSHVVVGNAHLAEYARRHNPAVTVVPTSIDTERYRPADRAAAGDSVIVGWTGSSTSQSHLELFAPVLREFFARHRGAQLRVVSNREPDLPGVPHVWRPWTPATEVDEIRSFDVGIMPIPDDPWARGKCALKALQCMAVGVPAVCSAVGANREVIRHGENGLLASTADEWLAHLAALCADPALRHRLGQAARTTVEQHYSMRRCADRYAQVIRQTLQAAGARYAPEAI
jgi:glycosyltransferase involved in cell wall biosynthesis